MKHLTTLLLTLLVLCGCGDSKQEKYSSIAECKAREMQKCNSEDCNDWTGEMCEEVLPKMFTESYRKQVQEIESQRLENMRKENEVLCKSIMIESGLPFPKNLEEVMLTEDELVDLRESQKEQCIEMGFN